MATTFTSTGEPKTFGLNDGYRSPMAPASAGAYEMGANELGVTEAELEPNPMGVNSVLIRQQGRRRAARAGASNRALIIGGVALLGVAGIATGVILAGNRDKAEPAVLTEPTAAPLAVTAAPAPTPAVPVAATPTAVAPVAEPSRTVTAPRVAPRAVTRSAPVRTTRVAPVQSIPEPVTPAPTTSTVQPLQIVPAPAPVVVTPQTAPPPPTPTLPETPETQPQG